MSKEIPDLVQRDVGTKGEEETEPVSAEASIMAQPFPTKTGPVRSFFSILEEDRVSVKDSVTLGRPVHGFIVGMGAGGSRHPVTAKFKFAKDEAATNVDTDEIGKTAFVSINPEKGKMSMGQMVELGWKSMGYSAPAGETISLVGKSTGMLDATSGGLHPRMLGLAK